MDKNRKAEKLVLEASDRARKYGMIYLILIILAGILGLLLWKWYALAASVVIGIIFNFYYSLNQAKKIARRTGLGIEEQAEILNKRSVKYVEPLPEKEEPEK